MPIIIKTLNPKGTVQRHRSISANFLLYTQHRSQHPHNPDSTHTQQHNSRILNCILRLQKEQTGKHERRIQINPHSAGLNNTLKPAPVLLLPHGNLDREIVVRVVEQVAGSAVGYRDRGHVCGFYGLDTLNGGGFGGGGYWVFGGEWSAGGRKGRGCAIRELEQIPACASNAGAVTTVCDCDVFGEDVEEGQGDNEP
jgi:hypothetical protein